MYHSIYSTKTLPIHIIYDMCYAVNQHVSAYLCLLVGITSCKSFWKSKMTRVPPEGSTLIDCPWLCLTVTFAVIIYLPSCAMNYPLADLYICAPCFLGLHSLSPLSIFSFLFILYCIAWNKPIAIRLIYLSFYVHSLSRLFVCWDRSSLKLVRSDGHIARGLQVVG
jgi:hypothetical protein